MGLLKKEKIPFLGYKLLSIFTYIIHTNGAYKKTTLLQRKLLSHLLTIMFNQTMKLSKQLFSNTSVTEVKMLWMLLLPPNLWLPFHPLQPSWFTSDKYKFTSQTN